MDKIIFRKYNKEKDKNAVHRIWKEVGWLEKGKEKVMDLMLKPANVLVAEINREIEVLAKTVPGTIKYLDEELKFSGVTAVTTSRIARKKGLASKLTARVIAESAEKGALVSGLGIFEQGFYDKLGYGSGCYEHIIYFDPADLKANSDFRIPKRLTKKDWKVIYKSRISRKRFHGAINFGKPETTHAEMIWDDKNFGLGYFDGKNGELTHHIWFYVKDVEQGPYWINWMCYQNSAQFLELLALIRSLGDQVRLVSFIEPPNIQMQDFLKQPFRFRQLTEKSKFENKMKATAFWQMRICNLEKCLERTHLNCENLKFNLELNDPIENYLEKDSKWKGIAGNYIITLGKKSKAEKGNNKKLPTLRSSVGAFTRMWLGVRPATGLAVSDEISGAEHLLEKLDKAFCIPEPKPDWEF